MPDLIKYALILPHDKLNDIKQTVANLNALFNRLGLQKSPTVKEAWVTEAKVARTRDAVPTVLFFATTQRAAGVALRKLQEMDITARFDPS